MNTDILMALLKAALTVRTDLKVVIMSATLNADLFAIYFGVNTILNIEGRTFPVSTHYLKMAPISYLDCALTFAITIHEKHPPGDILVFLTSVEEIERFCLALRGKSTHLEVLPLYATLSQEEQSKALARSTSRKCIVSTNIAESSLTIDGVVYVIGKSSHRYDRGLRIATDIGPM